MADGSAVSRSGGSEARPRVRDARLISIVIPTQRRPEGARRAIRSALAQADAGDAQASAPGVELVIVDNDTDPSAEALVRAIAAEAATPVRYVHEPKPGVSNARNAALAVARGDWILFLDDDEEAPPGWLRALAETQARCDADVVFGPVRARLPEGVRHRTYLEDFFSRTGPDAEGVIDGAYGCGNSLLRRACLPDPQRPFSEARNETGGEDDLLFLQMRARGARFAWSPKAWVFEDPEPGRLALGYALRRAFAYGHGPPAACAHAEPPDRIGVVRWMAVGLAQAIAHGLAAAMFSLVAPDRAPAHLDRAARGLGKTFWGRPFRQRFYGRVGVKPAAG